MTRVLYTGAFRFPDQDAAALRVASVARLFEQVGCTISFAGWERAPDGSHYVHEGHDCWPQSEFREEQLSPLARLLGFVTRGAKTLRWLSGRHRDYDVVVAYNPPALFSLLLLLRCRRWGMRAVLDSTEWYEGEHLPGGRFGLAALENWLRMRLVYPRFDHVICISRFLERHYAGRNVINIPPLVRDAANDDHRMPLAAGIDFVYAGDAGKKDRLVPFIRALPAIRDTLHRPVRLRIAGLDDNGLRRLLRDEGLDETTYTPLVECHGRVSRARVVELYRQSHFSVLFREDKRYARAGFPTKAVESWSHGCPIIANRVGDIGTLADDGVDAIVVDEAQLSSRLPAVLRSIVEANRYPDMSAQCRRKAGMLFSPDAHRLPFHHFTRQLGLPMQQP